MLIGIEMIWGDVERRDIHPFTVPAIRSLDRIDFTAPVTFLCGENGSGKSTLIEGLAVAAGFNAEGGPPGLMFETRSSHSSLHEHLRLSWRGARRTGHYLRAETFYNSSTAREEILGIDLHSRSHGELFLDALEPFAGRKPALHLMDEPESALSVPSQLRLLRLLYDAANAGDQFLISTHSPILLASPGATILRLDDAGISRVAYRDTEQYQLTKDFLDAPEAFFRHLLAEDDA